MDSAIVPPRPDLRIAVSADRARTTWCVACPRVQEDVTGRQCSRIALGWLAVMGDGTPRSLRYSLSEMSTASDQAHFPPQRKSLSQVVRELTGERCRVAGRSARRAVVTDASWDCMGFSSSDAVITKSAPYESVLSVSAPSSNALMCWAVSETCCARTERRGATMRVTGAETPIEPMTSPPRSRIGAATQETSSRYSRSSMEKPRPARCARLGEIRQRNAGAAGVTLERRGAVEGFQFRQSEIGEE